MKTDSIDRTITGYAGQHQSLQNNPHGRLTLPLTVYPMQLADVTIEEEYHNEHSGRHHGTSCLEEKQTVTLTDTQTNGALFYDNDQTLYF